MKHLLPVLMVLLWSIPALAQDSGMTMAQDPAMTAVLDSSATDTVTAATTKPSLSLGEQISTNKVLLYTIAAIAFILIITLTWISSVRKSKPEKTGNIGYRKPGGGTHHHHRHK